MKFTLTSTLLFCFLSSLFTITAQQPVLITQEKNLGTISHITYSPNGRYIASINEKDFLIKVWDIQSSKLIGTLVGHSASIKEVVFNASGDGLFSYDAKNKNYLWDLNTWNLKDSIVWPSEVKKVMINSDFSKAFAQNEREIFEYIRSSKVATPIVTKLKSPLVTFTVQGNSMVYATENMEVNFYDVNAKKVTKKLIPSAKSKAHTMLSDGENAVIAFQNGQISTFKLADGSELKSFSTGLTNAPTTLDINKKSQKIAFPKGSKQLLEFNYITGQLINEIPVTDNNENIKSVSYSADGITLATSGYKKLLMGRIYSNNNIIQIWNLPNKKQIKTLKGDVNPIDGFTFSPKENVLFLLRNDVVDIWNLNNGERITKVKLHERKIEVSARAGDAVNEKKEDVKEDVVNDIKSGNISKIKTVKDIASGDFSGVKGKVTDVKTTTVQESKYIGKAAFTRFGFQEDKMIISKNEHYMVTAFKEDEIRLYSIEDYALKHISYVKTGQKEFFDVLIDPKEEFIVVGGSGKHPVSVIQISEPTKPKTLYVDDTQDLKMGGAFQTANAMALSPDGNRLIVAFNTGRIVIWDTHYWSKVSDFRSGVAMTMSPFVGFSADGNKFFVNTAIGIITYDFTVFNQIVKDEPISEGKTLNLEKAKVNGHPVMTHMPMNYLVSIDHHHVNFLDVLNNKTHTSSTFNTKLITDIQVNKFGYAGVSLKNGELRIYDPATAKERFIMVGEEDNALFKTPENYYKVTKEGHDLVIFRVGKDAYPFEQFDTKYNRPDIVLHAMNSEDEGTIKLYKNAYDKRLAKLGLKESDLDNSFRAPSVEITNLQDIPLVVSKNQITFNINATEKNSQLRKLAIYINDVPIYGVKGMPISGSTFSKEITIDLASGINRIQISVENSGGIESLKQTIEIENTETVKPNLYILSIGTSLYKDKRYNLNYAAKDAKDLVTIFTEGKSSAYGNVKHKTITNQEATRITIESIKTFLQDAQINDVVMVFVAGHGLLDANYDYFYGTHDIDFLKPQTKGLAYQSLENLLDGIKPLKKILIMDTCHSGEVEEDDLTASDETTTDENSDDVMFRAVGPKLNTVSGMSPSKMMKELFVDLRKGTGTTVISSAGGAEFAMESNEWKNGLFTYCLLFGLRNGSADLDKDGKIMLSELQLYTTDRVTQLSKGKQTPTTRIQNIQLDYQIW